MGSVEHLVHHGYQSRLNSDNISYPDMRLRLKLGSRTKINDVVILTTLEVKKKPMYLDDHFHELSGL